MDLGIWILNIMQVARYQEEMRNLKWSIRQRQVTSITAGETIMIEGTPLFPIDLRFDNAPCYPYMLLLRRGVLDDADNTPYFFRSRQKRDQIITYLVG